MDIRAIVEQTLVAPMRAQAAEYRVTELEKLLERKQQELQQAHSLSDWYRTQNAGHESLIADLYERFSNKAARDELLLWDEMHDMVRAAHLAIHGPSDSDL